MEKEETFDDKMTNSSPAFSENESTLANKKKKKKENKGVKSKENTQEEISLEDGTKKVVSTGATKEMPMNPFDFIWNTDNLMPKIEDNGESLGTINEEFSNPTVSRNKSILGGKVAKLSETEKNLTSATLGELINSNTISQHTFSSSTNENEELNVSLNKRKETEKEKANKKKKEKNKSKNSSKLDDSLILVDEFNRQNQNSSSSNGDSIRFLKSRHPTSSLTQIDGPSRSDL
jgi:hypothetical protein